MFDDTESHEMELIATRESGAEEWLCPTCGRRFVMQWPPNFKRVILEEGDEDVIHSGGKGGVQMQPPTAQEVEDTEPVLSAEMRAALEELDFGDWPDQA
jgi:hypothetical protein